MIRSAVILWLSSLAALTAAEERPDLIRFTNSDQLHGSFRGIKDGPLAVWQRDDLQDAVAFKTERVRHIVLHGGRPLKPLESLSYITLVNGDRIPGTVTGIDDAHITIDSACAGVLHIPRQQVSRLSPNPLGGRVYYHGPFSEDGWETARTGLADDEPPDDGGQPGSWAFSGSAWYWQGQRPNTALIHKTGMPDHAVFSFELAWRNRLSLAIAFHADFAQAVLKDEPKDENGKLRRMPNVHQADSSDLPRLFGNSDILHLDSNFLRLLRSSVDGDGNTSLDRVQINSRVRLSDSGRAKVEIRSNRSSGEISLFINEEFVAQWSESDMDEDPRSKPLAHGAGFGFAVQGIDSPVRISDIVISEWNGMPDSARSLQIDGQDVVLMANGTDRYAGKIDQLDENGRIIFEGKYGSSRFPLNEVAEIRFSRDQLAEAPETPADQVSVRLSPVGSISGRPLSGDDSMISILSPVCGVLNLSLESAVMLDFNTSNQFIDDWDADF